MYINALNQDFIKIFTHVGMSQEEIQDLIGKINRDLIRLLLLAIIARIPKENVPPFAQAVKESGESLGEYVVETCKRHNIDLVDVSEKIMVNYTNEFWNGFLANMSPEEKEDLKNFVNTELNDPAKEEIYTNLVNKLEEY